MENNGLYFSICPTDEDISSPTPKQETSQLSSRCMEHALEPNTAAEPEPAAIKAPALDKATERNIAPEPELHDATDRGCEPCTAVGLLVEIAGLEGSPAHTPAAEGELQLASGHYY